MSPRPSRARAGLLLTLACAWSCAGPSSPVAPDPPDPPLPGTPGEITVSASGISLGAIAAEGSVALRNVGTGSLSWVHETTASWVTASPSGGTLAGGASVPVRIVVNRGGLEPGVHTGRVRFVFGDEHVDVDVTLEVPQPALPMAEVSPVSLALGIDDVSASVYVTNAGGAPLTWSWSGPTWAAIAPASGTTAPGSTTSVVVTPARGALADDTHTVTLAFDSNGGDRDVTLSVAVAGPARLGVSPSSVDFGATGESARVTIRNDGGRPLTWTATDDSGWLTFDPATGSVPPHANAAIDLAAARGGLTAGTYAGTLSISSNAGAATVAVEMSVPVPEPPPPPPTPPPPPLPPPPSSVALTGRVVDQFDGRGVAGLTVRFAGETATTDANGGFTVPGNPSNTLRDLALSGSGVHSRATFARSSDNQWRIVPSSFNMSAFDDLAREYEPRTIRWMSSPSVYVDTRPDAFAGGPELAQWISEVQSDAAAFISDWSGGVIQAGSVTVGSSPPPDGTPGTIVIHFSEDDARYGAPSTVGLARTFWAGDRSIASAAIWLRFVRYGSPAQAGIRRAVLGHELGHGLGMGHMNGGTSSIMTPSVSSTSLTSFDADAGLLLYTRSPGNTSPDVDNLATYRGSLAPSKAVGSYEWVCGATARP